MLDRELSPSQPLLVFFSQYSVLSNVCPFLNCEDIIYIYSANVGLIPLYGINFIFIKELMGFINIMLKAL